MSYFKHHVFICTNQREGGEQCCNNVGGSDMFAYAKDRIGAMKRELPGRRARQQGRLPGALR